MSLLLMNSTVVLQPAPSAMDCWQFPSMLKAGSTLSNIPKPRSGSTRGNSRPFRPFLGSFEPHFEIYPPALQYSDGSPQG